MMPSERPRLSVVVPVHNGREFIGHCLDALMASEGGPPEVLVVDDASTDETPAIVARYPVRLLRLKTNGGPAIARNRGADHATSQNLFFVDADVVVRSDTVRRVAEQFHDDPDLAAFFGSYDSNPQAGNFLSQYRNLLHYAVHQQGREYAETFWSGCGAIRKSVFLAMGGFNESYDRPSIEDIELGARLNAAGHRIRLIKDLQVKHLKRWSLAEIIHTDMCARAIPWTTLILSGYHRGGGLNLQFRYRLSVGVAGLAMAAAGGAVFFRHWGLVAAALILFYCFACLNRNLLRIFHRCRGPLFALLTVPMLLLYYCYSSVGFVAGVIIYVFKRGPG